MGTARVTVLDVATRRGDRVGRPGGSRPFEAPFPPHDVHAGALGVRRDLGQEPGYYERRRWSSLIKMLDVTPWCHASSMIPPSPTRVGRRSIVRPAGVVFAGLLALVGCTSVATSTEEAGDGAATVSRVVDGDTVLLRLAGREESVRLLGIDTPETVKPRTPVQCFGREATDRTKALLPGGTAVRVVRDAELRDDYGRLLAYVYRRSDGLFVNLALVEDGFAVPNRYPPNVAHASVITAAARDARAAGRGIWSACPPSSIPRHPGGP